MWEKIKKKCKENLDFFNSSAELLRNITTLLKFLAPLIVGITGIFTWWKGLETCRRILIVADCTVITLLMLVAILINKIRKMNDKNKELENTRSDHNYADNEFVKLFWEGEIEAVKNKKKHELDEGYFALSGDEVKEYQSKLLNLLLDHKEDEHDRQVLALDLTEKPERLLHATRDEYHQANKNYVRRGGTIKRIFIVDIEKLKDHDFCENLSKVIKKNKKEMEIQEVGLYFRHLVRDSRNIRDVIVYGNCAAIFEEVQLAENTLEGGVSHIIFSDQKVRDFKNIFNSYDIEEAKKYCILFENYISSNKSSDFDFNKLFEQLEVQLYEGAGG